MQFAGVASPGIYWSLSAIVGLLVLKVIKDPKQQLYDNLATQFN